jgi:hypothetical protein
VVVTGFQSHQRFRNQSGSHVVPLAVDSLRERPVVEVRLEGPVDAVFERERELGGREFPRGRSGFDRHRAVLAVPEPDDLVDLIAPAGREAVGVGAVDVLGASAVVRGGSRAVSSSVVDPSDESRARHPAARTAVAGSARRRRRRRIRRAWRRADKYFPKGTVAV